MGRRGGDVESHEEAHRHEDMEWVVLYPCVVDKNGEGYLGARDPSSIPDHPSQGSSTRKVSPYNFWL